MSLVTLNLRPTDKLLRDFGSAAVIMLSAIGLSLWLFNRISLLGLAVFCGAGMLIFVMSRISVRMVKPVYQIITIITFPIGWIVSHAVMAIFFFGLITPIGLIFKIIGRDPLCRSYDSNASTYWRPYEQKRSLKDYFRQF